MVQVCRGAITGPRVALAAIAGLTFLWANDVPAAAGSAADRADAGPGASSPEMREGVSLYIEQVRPVFEAHCLECHGGRARKGGLDLTTREGLLRGGDSGPAIVAGDAAESLLYKLVTHAQEPGMPYQAPRLPEETIQQITAWLNAGAPYADAPSDGAGGASPEPPGSGHWAFEPRAEPAVPQVGDTDRVRNPIDAFVLARLEKEGIPPSPEADRRTLIRRLSLDLIGLLPAPEEVEAFVSDTSPDAYRKLVDRLLDSPHFGERWGRHWLDVARYADSDGYEKDSPRPWAWRYRDWVIDAINRDLPFHQFTIEQLAGDLLPDATIEQQVATGFHRNTLTNKEGGVDPEEFRVKAVVDRVSTTGSVWLGLTVGCAECHSHKYDPITQREFYGLFAFFNDTDDEQIVAPLPEQMERYRKESRPFQAVRKELIEARDAYREHALPARQAEWEREQKASLAEWLTLKPALAVSWNGAALEQQPDGSVLATGEPPPQDVYTVSLHTDATGITGLKLEVLPHETLPARGPGRAENGNVVLSEVELYATPVEDPSLVKRVALSHASADHEQENWPAGAAIDGKPETGWAIMPHAGAPHRIVFEAAEPVSFEGGTILTAVLHQNYGSEHMLGRFRVSATTSERPVRVTRLPDAVAAALRTPADRRNDKQRQALAKHYEGIDSGLGLLNKTIAEHDKSAPSRWAPKARVLARADKPRETHVHVRGDFLNKGPQVVAHTPACLPPMTRLADSQPPDRLDLARWLVSPENPLTARVTVNRWWQYLFGTGLVATPEDFGVRGEKPSHPELLDWLANELIDRGWSRKEMIRLIVESATYRQASHTRRELIDRDPKNRLLARQNRFRVTAEIVRDLGLQVSGLLTPTIGGPSVRPPQPPGIAELTYAGSARWEESTGPDRYRRGLYIWFQRTSPYPMLMTFDGPDGTVTCLARERSNTPLQSLTLLNDPVFVECAQAFGGRLIEDVPGGPDARIRHAYRLALCREPTEFELQELTDLYEALLEMNREDVKAAATLSGLSEATDEARLIEAATWTALARTVMNLDEFMTRE